MEFLNVSTPLRIYLFLMNMIELIALKIWQAGKIMGAKLRAPLTSRYDSAVILRGVSWRCLNWAHMIDCVETLVCRTAIDTEKSFRNHIKSN